MSGFQIKGRSLHLRALPLLFSAREFTFHYYRPPTKLREGNVFTRVCFSFYSLKHVRSGSGRCASYWNDSLSSNESYNPCFCVNYDTTKGIMAQSKRTKFYGSSFKYQLIWQLSKYQLHGKSRLKFLASSFMWLLSVRIPLRNTCLLVNG